MRAFNPAGSRLPPGGFPFAATYEYQRNFTASGEYTVGNAQYLGWLALAAAVGVLLYLLAPYSRRSSSLRYSPTSAIRWSTA